MNYEGWEIGHRIKTFRKERGISRSEFGLKLGVSTSHISQIEQGSRKMSIDLLFRLMNVLNLDANTLLGVSNFSESVSVDEVLETLDETYKVYFRTIFLQMIQKHPAKQ